MREMTCILCPRGCLLRVDEETRSVEGNRCPKGLEYALKELTNPTRVITTTVRTDNPDFPRLPVQTDGEVPLGEIFLFMREINEVTAPAAAPPGAVLKENLRGSGINLISTGGLFS